MQRRAMQFLAFGPEVSFAGRVLAFQPELMQVKPAWVGNLHACRFPIANADDTIDPTAIQQPSPLGKRDRARPTTAITSQIGIDRQSSRLSPNARVLRRNVLIHANFMLHIIAYNLSGERCRGEKPGGGKRPGTCFQVPYDGKATSRRPTLQKHQRWMMKVCLGKS